MPDTSRLDRIIAALPLDDAAYLSALVEPKSKQRERRLARRDNAVREALALLDHSGVTGAACALERLLRRYLDGPRIAPEDDAPDLRRLLHRIAEANEWQPLGWRQLARIAAGERTPVMS